MGKVIEGNEWRSSDKREQGIEVEGRIYSKLVVMTSVSRPIDELMGMVVAEEVMVKREEVRKAGWAG